MARIRLEITGLSAQRLDSRLIKILIVSAVGVDAWLISGDDEPSAREEYDHAMGQEEGGAFLSSHRKAADTKKLIDYPVLP